MPFDMPFDGDLSCPDWIEKLKAGETPMPEVPLDDGLAGVAVRIFDQLRLPDVAGQPTLGEVGGEWFRDILRALFGCIDPETKIRYISELFLLVPKKNSKTTNSAALGLIALMVNTIPNAKMVIIGPTQGVAETCFSQLQGMIDADPELGKMFHVQDHLKKVKYIPTGAVLAIKSFDMNVVTGGIPIFAIIDELHLMSSKSYAKKVIGQIRGGMNKANCLLVFITTQSVDEPAGIFRTELLNARAVRNGETPAEGLLAVLYEFSEEMQSAKGKPFLDPKYWPMVMPNLGKSVFMDLLQREFRKAEAKGLEDLQLWLSQHLNIQIGVGIHNDRWKGADYWESCADDMLTLAEIKRVCDVCVVGIDGGGLDDLLGLAVLGRHADTRDWMLWVKAWVQTDVLKDRPEIAERLQDFAETGDLVICEDLGEDLDSVADICADLNDAGLLPDDAAVGLDPEGVADIVDALAMKGLTDDQVRPIGQGYKLNAAINGLPRKLKKGTFHHCDQPLMAWCVGNAKTELRGNARMVTKQRSGLAKIDPLMAAFDAVMLMSRNPEAATGAAISISKDYRVC
jgi:phage terminase large subunit-like protein